MGEKAVMELVCLPVTRLLCFLSFIIVLLLSNINSNTINCKITTNNYKCDRKCQI